MSHAGLTQSLSPFETGSVIHNLVSVFNNLNDVSLVKQTTEYKHTVEHTLLDAYIEGDCEFRQLIRKPIRQIYEKSVSEACIAALTTLPQTESSHDYVAHLQKLEQVLRSFYVFKYGSCFHF